MSPQAPPCSNGSAAPAQPLPLSPDAVDRALRAHWPTFDTLRPDITAVYREKMEAALRAALTK